MTVATEPRTIYAQRTASMPGEPAAPLHEGAARLRPQDLRRAACVGSAARMDWVPDHEASVVPEQMRRICSGCADRLGCLQRAIGTGSEGYWAATTTADRKKLGGAGAMTIEGADAVQAELRARLARAEQQDLASALHPPGQGDLKWYRLGCHCSQCRGCNAAKRAQERGRHPRSRPGRAA